MIEQHMGEEVDYTRVAAALGLSLYRFHHLFVERTGGTPGAYLRRIRLDAAAARLRWTRETVGHIAANVGYSSQSSFNKAFERRYGVKPLAFRKDREIWPANPTDSVTDKRVRLVEIENFRLLARRYVGAPCFAPSYWADFLASLPEGLESRQRDLFVGILHDDMRFTPPEQCRYDCCIAVGESFGDEDMAALPSGFSRLVLRPGLCATLRYRGYYAGRDSPDGNQCISHAYSHLLDHWMIESRHTFAGEYVAEIYTTAHTRCAQQDLECTILAPLR